VTIRIARLELREIRLVLKEAFRISSGVVTERRVLLVMLTDADGHSVWAECVAGEQPNYSPETIDTAWFAMREWLGPRLFAADLFHPREVAGVLSANVRGHPMAKAALEMGCWGLAAVREGVSLTQVLGGTRDRVATGISLGIQATPDALVERARAARAAGYNKIKVKIAPGSDVPFVRAVRESLGPDVHLMADANSAYTLSDADHLAQLDEFELIMLEQPLGQDDLVRHAALQRRMRTPICLDESILDVQRAEDMIALGSGRIVNIKPGRVGGYASSLAIHDLCKANGVPVWCGGMLESGIGRAYNIALASLPNFTLPGDLSPSARYWERDIVMPEWTMDGDGMVRVPRDVPGLGVEVDAGRVDDLTARYELLEPAPVAAR
jgi:O-succinylbenzoate synthase